MTTKGRYRNDFAAPPLPPRSPSPVGLDAAGASNRTQPVLSACQPGRCPNATIEARHRPVWVTARGRLAELLRRPALSEPKRALLDAELAEVDRTLSSIPTEESDADR